MRHASMFTARRAGPMLLGAAVLSASLLARFLVAPDTHAAIGGCRSDPVAMLSNGYTLDIETTVTDSASDVQNVAYTLVVPKGVTLVSWTDTAELDPHDTYVVNDNNSAGHYAVGVNVTTGTSNVPVNAFTILLDPTGLSISTYSVSGLSGQQLWMDVQQPGS